MGEIAENARSHAREAFRSAGLTYDVLTPANMQRLRNLVNERMKASGAILGTFRCRQRGIVRQTPRGLYAELRCRADYFDNREAVTFNNDGFIGFAGWADDRNVQPIIDGFKAWVGELAEATSKEAGE